MGMGIGLGMGMRMGLGTGTGMKMGTGTGVGTGMGIEMGMRMGIGREPAGDAPGSVGHPVADTPPAALHRGEQHQAAAAADPEAAITAGLGASGAAHGGCH